MCPNGAVTSPGREVEFNTFFAVVKTDVGLRVSASAKRKRVAAPMKEPLFFPSEALA